MRLASAVGTRLPALRTAVGKANLAYIDSSEARLSPAELARIRTDGYAVDEGEIISGVRCVAAPVFDASNICCGGIGVSYLRDGGPPAAKVAVAVIEAADRSSRQLGGRTPRTCG